MTFEAPRSRRQCPAALTLFAAVTVGSSGCSLVFTRGPQTGASPIAPERCTSTNGYAIADTVLAALSFAAAVGGTILVIDSTKCPHPGTCEFGAVGEGVTGLGLLGAGLVSTAIFTPSAVVGYNRAAACREWEALPAPIPGRVDRP